ncbi:hypothetical protein J7L13_01710 [bacterium]|nr:hypothetical protein [bacterium]
MRSKVLAFGLSLLLAFLFSPLPAFSAVGELDQVNEVDTSDGSLTIRSHQEICQTFIPTLNRLNGVGFFVEGAEKGDEVAVVVKDLSANQVIVSTSTTIEEPDGWNVAPFEAVKVYSDHLYALCLNTPSATMMWTYKDYDSYPKGYAIWDSKEDLSKDFGFLTFGLNVAEEEQQENQSEESQTQEESTPSEESTLSAPQNVSAQDVPDDQGKAIKISWKAVSGAEGYNVYRRKAGEKDFQKLASTTSLVYIDRQVQPNEEYEYRITAYKAQEESPPSEIVKAKAIDNLPPAKPTHLEVKVLADGKTLVISWQAPEDEDLAGFVLRAISEEEKILLLKELKKDETEFLTEKLDLNQKFTIKVQAKDSSGNLSEPAEFKYEPGLKLAEATVEQPQQANRVQLWLALIFAILAVGGSGIIVWRQLKRGRTRKIKVEKEEEKKG